MNKSIILSAMLALSMPAFAADVLYVNGNDTQTINGQTPSWSVVTPIEVQPTNGKFIVEVKSFSDISISTVKAAIEEDWTTWGTGQYCISNWVKDVKVGDGFDDNGGFEDGGNQFGSQEKQDDNEKEDVEDDIEDKDTEKDDDK